MSTEISARSHKSPNHYRLKGGNGSSGLSTAIYGSGKNTAYTRKAYCVQSYNPECLIDSPTEELLHPTCSGIYRNSFDPLNDGSFRLRNEMSPPISAEDLYSNSVSLRHTDPYQSNSESEYLESQSPELVNFNGDEMQLKLQELERALFDDNDEDMIDLCQSMNIDAEYGASTGNKLLHDSPKESSTSDSNLSSISSNKDVFYVSPQTPKQLLYNCAVAISEGRLDEALEIINNVRDMVSIQGDPSQRIAAYMVEGLAARMSASGKFLYKALRCKEPPSCERLAAMQILYEVCPCFKFGYMAANGAMMEAFKGEKRVHIIDYDINQGTQYINLIQSLADQQGKVPHLRLTGVDDPESVQRPIGGLHNILQRLEKLAEALDVPFEFQAVASKTSVVTPSMLDCRPGETIVVNFAFQLHHMPDESVSIVNQRDQLLQMVKSLNPKLVTVVEQDVNTNTTPFLPRFVEAYDYYHAVFDSLDVTLPRESQDRMNVEKQCLARDIVNIVACEGEERIERYEVAGKWRARMMMAGFSSTPISPNVTDAIRKVIKQYCDRYKVKEEFGALNFGWEDKNLIVTSAWK